MKIRIAVSIDLGNQTQAFPIYLVVDTNEVQVSGIFHLFNVEKPFLLAFQVSNDDPKPVRFQNEDHKILKDISTPGASIANQSFMISSRTNGDYFICKR